MRNYMKFFLMCFMFFFGSFTLCCALEEKYESHVQDEKVYVSNENIFISDNAIYLDLGNGYRFIQHLQADDLGLFVTFSALDGVINEACRHAPSCNKCGGCNNGVCAGRCRCQKNG